MMIRSELKVEYLERLKRELLRREAQHSLADFILYTTPNYLMGWVHKEICSTLDRFYEDVKEKKSPRLIICLPPRSGKSQIVSRAFPAYLLGRNPDLSVIATSYSADLSSRFNRDVQRIIEDKNYSDVFPNTKLAPKGMIGYTRTSDFFEIVGHTGAYRSAGVGGGITGQGADVLICDDLIKDRADADSNTVREHTWDWYTSTAYTRLSPGGGVIVMGTRWHQDDPTGRLIYAMEAGAGDKFTVINYPAIAEEDEPHRKKGEALHPERYDIEALRAIQRTLGAYQWSALYQQHPVPREGALFNLAKFKRYDDKSKPVSFEKIIGSWDMTFKDSLGSDFVVGQIWGKSGADFYLLDEVRGQWDFVKTLEIFLALDAEWPKVMAWLVEDKANGSAIISSLKKHISGIKAITPTESKVARAEAIAVLVETGNVYLPKSASYLTVLENELANFPAVKHDDQVDTMTQALNYFKEHTHSAVHPNNLKALRFRR